MKKVLLNSSRLTIRQIAVKFGCLCIVLFVCSMVACTVDAPVKQEVMVTPPLPERPSVRSSYARPLIEQVIEKETQARAIQMGTDMAESRYCYCVNNSDFGNNDAYRDILLTSCEATSDKNMQELIDQQATYKYKQIMRDAYEEVKANCKKLIIEEIVKKSKE